jgi:hypothetical protein
VPIFIKREFTWAEGARKSSIRFSVKIAPVAGEPAATTTRRFKLEAARLARAFIEAHDADSEQRSVTLVPVAISAKR